MPNALRLISRDGVRASSGRVISQWRISLSRRLKRLKPERRQQPTSRAPDRSLRLDTVVSEGAASLESPAAKPGDEGRQVRAAVEYGALSNTAETVAVTCKRTGPHVHLWPQRSEERRRRTNDPTLDARA